MMICTSKGYVAYGEIVRARSRQDGKLDLFDRDGDNLGAIDEYRFALTIIGMVPVASEWEALIITEDDYRALPVIAWGMTASGELRAVTLPLANNEVTEQQTLRRCGHPEVYTCDTLFENAEAWLAEARAFAARQKPSHPGAHAAPAGDR